MALTEKGQQALDLIKQYFTTGAFSAKDLSNKAGVTVAAATLTALAKKGLLNRQDTKPVTYLFDAEFAADYNEEVVQKSANNNNLRAAKQAKNDEFYTRREDIEAELSNYRKYFIGKTIFLNCDDPRESEFWKFFERQFGFLQLKKLISTHYEPNGKSYKLEYFGDVDIEGNITDAQIIKTPLEGNGDFRSQECINILQESDIVVTNPPFSLFREYVAQLMQYNKHFLIIGSKNAITYKEIFKLIKENKIWIGMTNPKKFFVPEGYSAKNVEYDKNLNKIVAKFGNIGWFTNLPTKRRNEELSTGARYYDENHKIEDYPHYDNYDAIEVSKVANIPMDYEGVMGVPITYLDKYNPDQFEVIGGFNGYKECDYENGLICGSLTEYYDNKTGKIKTWTGPTINKHTKYYRVLIRNKHPRRLHK